MAGVDSAGSESSIRKEVEEESGKRSEMAGRRSKVHGRKVGRPVRIDSNKEPAVMLTGMDSAGGESTMQKEAERAGKIFPTHIKGNLPTKKKAKKKEDEPRKPEDSVAEAVKAEAPMTEAAKAQDSDQEARAKRIQGRMEMRQQALLQSLKKWPTKEKAKAKDEEPADPTSTNLMTIQDDHLDRGISELAKKTADEEASEYALYRQSWESAHCKNCDHFENLTVLSSMQFTHYTPKMTPYNSTGTATATAVDTLQIFSMKLKLTNDIAGGFELPLSVYGVVAVRDSVDSSRNILFSRGRTMAQELTQDDPFLHLTGPSRVIVSMDSLCFEIQLKVKGAAASQDKPLITCARCDRGLGGPGVSTLSFKNVFCTLELCSQPLKQTVQATILGVQIVKKKELWPLSFTYGGLVACTPLPRMATGSGVSSNQIVLIESKGRAMLTGVHGHVHPRRQVVSVERGGGLDVVVQAYSKSGAVHAKGHVNFMAQDCHVSQQKCIVGEAQVTVSVAWSLGPKNMLKAAVAC